MRVVNILLVGLGSIGRRHARLLRGLYPGFRLFALRSGHGVAGGAGDPGVETVPSWEAAERLGGGVAFVTNPTSLHVETALRCARMGFHLFLEKPIGCSRAGLAELAGTLERGGLVSYVAYNLRFHPLLERLRGMLPGLGIASAEAECVSWLPDWRPGTDHLASYSARAAQGGGVLLDLSHELDYVDHLFGGVRQISGNFGRRAGVTVDAEDWADLDVVTGKVPEVKVRLDIGSRERRRALTLRLRDGQALRADLLASTLEGGGLPAPIVVPCSSDQAYEAQLRHFFAGLEAGGRGLMNTLPAALPLFEKILAFKEAA